MFFSKRAFFSTIGLAVVVSVSGWFVVKTAQRQISTASVPDDFVISTANEITNIKTNKSGQIAYIAKAQKAKRFENEDAWFYKVDVLFYNKDRKQEPWHITSDYGKVTNNDNNVHLYQKVIMQRQAAGKNAPAVKITTDEVFYDDKKDQLNTDRLVTITQPGTDNITTGEGLIGHPKTGNYKLLKNVRSYYAGQNE
ncbi:LPS export ABC transporter periplasmic protein LptC [Facilibium subflavum]|uniref:LPS export ABC transporter periplasmic protein LptC n=1 Tax=Facilibium subflavum TaxID=2219058 RepID=UPI000E64A590|nr:LPS export ABC transporter periplasmic protein LptC [Facilibium subflavum]